ncbi:MAG: capsid protein [Cressdnaviricota sp.]|nr:MAG: capsid protein [Cressdnaviricota sp.]
MVRSFRRRSFKRRSFKRKSYGYRKRPAYRRKRFSSYRKKRFSRRRSGVMKPVYIWRKTTTAYVTCPIAGTNSATTYVTVNLLDFTDYSTWTALYDEYKINKVTVKWHCPQWNRTGSGATTSTTTGTINEYQLFNPNMLSVIDKDGTYTKTLPSDMMLDPSCRTWAVGNGRGTRRSWFPKYTVMGPPDGENDTWIGRRGWLSTDYMSIDHYGMNFIVDNTEGPVDWSDVQLFYEVWMQVGFRKLSKGRVFPNYTAQQHG